MVPCRSIVASLILLLFPGFSAAQTAARAVPEAIADPIDPSLELEPVTDQDLPDDPARARHAVSTHPAGEEARVLLERGGGVLVEILDVAPRPPGVTRSELRLVSKRHGFIPAGRH